MAFAIHLMVILASVAVTSLGLMDIFYTLALVLLYLGLCRSLGYLKARFTRKTNPLCSEWYDVSKRDQYEELCSQLKPGDIVEISTKYSPDFAICVEKDRENEWSLVLPRKCDSARKIPHSDESSKLTCLVEKRPDLLTEGSKSRINNARDKVSSPQKLYSARKITHSDKLDEGGRGSRKIFLHQLTCLVKKRPDLLIEGSKIRINNARDKVSSPKAVADIVMMMRQAVHGEEEKIFGRYNPSANNCRHFAERARYPKEALDNRLNRDRGWWLNWWFGPPHCSPWFREEDLETFRWLVRPGDIVEFDRVLYSHWAIFQDHVRNTLLHRSGISAMKFGPVKVDKISEVIKGSRFRINNSLDQKYESKVNERLTYRLVSDSLCYGGYNLVLNNARHFAEQMRYGIHFRKNLGLTLSRPSVLALRPDLLEGDIIRCLSYDNKGLLSSVRHLYYAVYLGNELDRNGPDQVVYGCYHYGEQGGPSNGILEPLEDFHKRTSTCDCFQIDNLLDHLRPPLELEEIVAAANTAIKQKVNCKCRDFENSKLFAEYLRNGTEEQWTARAYKALFHKSRFWRIMLNLYPAWHRLVCKDCHHM